MADQIFVSYESTGRWGCTSDVYYHVRFPSDEVEDAEVTMSREAFGTGVDTARVIAKGTLAWWRAVALALHDTRQRRERESAR